MERYCLDVTISNVPLDPRAREVNGGVPNCVMKPYN